MSASSFAAKLIEVKQETRSNKTSHQEDSCAHLDAVFKTDSQLKNERTPKMDQNGAQVSLRKNLCSKIVDR